MRIGGLELCKILIITCSGSTTPHEMFSCGLPFTISFIGLAMCSKVAYWFMPQTQDKADFTLCTFLPACTVFMPTPSPHTRTHKHVLVLAGLNRGW